MTTQPQLDVDPILNPGVTRIPWVPTGAQMIQLTQPLNRNRVATRTQAGSKLSYVEAWDIKRMLIRVFGFASFSADVIEAKVLKMDAIKVADNDWVDNPSGSGKKIPKQKQDKDGNLIWKDQWRVLAQCTVRLTVHASGATYTEAAAATQNGPDLGEVTDFAIKTAESDALKRAAIYLGTQFGLSLYDSGSLEDVVGRVLEPFQSDIHKAGIVAAQEAARKQREAVAAGGAVQSLNGPQPGAQPQQERVAPAEAPADYGQGDPNENDQLGTPPTSGLGAVAGAFNHDRSK